MKLTKSKLKQLIKEELQKVLITEFFGKNTKWFKSDRYDAIACKNHGKGPCYAELPDRGGWKQIMSRPGPDWTPCKKQYCDK